MTSKISTRRFFYKLPSQTFRMYDSPDNQTYFSHLAERKNSSSHIYKPSILFNLMYWLSSFTIKIVTGFWIIFQFRAGNLLLPKIVIFMAGWEKKVIKWWTTVFRKVTESDMEVIVIRLISVKLQYRKQYPIFCRL